MRRAPAALFAVVTIVGIGRIVATYDELTNVFDEPIHLACGMQLLDRGVYQYEDQHPPLARVAAAAIPYLGGVRSRGHAEMEAEGRAILYEGGDYRQTLAWSRMGMLPFFGVIVWSSFLLARRIGGDWAGVAAAGLASGSPIILANSGIALTDAAFAGFGALTLAAYLRWRQDPSTWNSAGLGLAGGLALSSKFSAIPFIGLPLAAAVAYDVARSSSARKRLIAVSLATVVAFAVLCASYGFDLGPRPFRNSADRPYDDIDRRVGGEGLLHDLAYAAAEAPIPGVAFHVGNGLLQLSKHARRGHPSFLLGQVASKGLPFYFVVALAVRSTIPMLLLSGAGFYLLIRLWLRRRDWTTAAVVLLWAWALLFSSLGTLTFSDRHVLILYPLMAAAGGVAVQRAWRARAAPPRVAALLLLGWHAGAGIAAHPDYLAHFNALASPEPERVMIVMDNGQDLDRLAAELRRRGIDDGWLVYKGTADPAWHGVPQGFREAPEDGRVRGWLAISIATRQREPERFGWLEKHEPAAVVGSSIWLYHIP